MGTASCLVFRPLEVVREAKIRHQELVPASRFLLPKPGCDVRVERKVFSLSFCSLPLCDADLERILLGACDARPRVRVDGCAVGGRGGDGNGGRGGVGGIRGCKPTLEPTIAQLACGDGGSTYRPTSA